MHEHHSNRIDILFQFIVEKEGNGNLLFIDPDTKHAYNKDPGCSKIYRCCHRKSKSCHGMLKFDCKGKLKESKEHEGHTPFKLLGRQKQMFQELKNLSRDSFTPFTDIFDSVSAR